MEIIIAAIIGLIGGAISGLIAANTTKAKNNADAAKAASDAVVNLLAPMNERVDYLEDELRRFKNGVNRLIAQIRCLGKEPDWTPEMDTVRLPRRNGRSEPPG